MSVRFVGQPGRGERDQHVGDRGRDLLIRVDDGGAVVVQVAPSRSTTTRPSTESTSGPVTRSSRPLPPYGSEPGSPGPGSRACGVAMAFKLIEAAQARWRMVNAPHLVAHTSLTTPAWSRGGA